jgi:hypothetical protein
MSWYRTGTIAVTNGSITVNGAGTAFVNAVLPGWGLVAAEHAVPGADPCDRRRPRHNPRLHRPE